MTTIRDQLVKHRRIIKLVAVGNEPYLPPNRAQAMPYIQAAFNNVVKLVAANGLANDIKVWYFLGIHSGLSRCSTARGSSTGCSQVCPTKVKACKSFLFT